MFSILSSSKDFSDPWIGSRALNRLDLHVNRVRLADFATRTRRVFSGAQEDKWTNHFRENGYVTIPDFLPSPEYENLYAHAKKITLEAMQNHPPLPPRTTGFGAKQLFKGGLDRYDGSTLNRFLYIEYPEKEPLYAFAKDKRLDALCRAVTGFSLDTKRMQFYLTINGEEAGNPDIQKVLHKDTFHSSLKFWYFLEDVKEDDGPFVYVPGSHKITAERLEWERRSALVACGERQDPTSLNSDGGGSFRIRENELEELQLPAPISLPVSGNTLVLADTLGFHRRGDAKSGTQRLALYGWRRPWPFLPKGW